jgi:tRNA pseudouridine13 synthase
MGNLLSRSSSDQGKGNKRPLDPEESFENGNKRGRFDNEYVIAIKESDVGIQAFVNPHLKGFHSILKYR